MDIKFSAYTLTTPIMKANEATQLGNVFMPNLVEKLIKKLVELENKEKKLTIKNEKYLQLGNLVKVNGENILEGNFITTTYGIPGDIIDSSTGETSYRRSLNEGNRTVVYFLLNLSEGVLLVQDDESNVLTMENIRRYFREKQYLIKDEIEKFNSSQNDYILPLQYDLISLTQVLPKDFIEEVKKCSNVKHISLEYAILSSDEEFISTISNYVTTKGLSDTGKISIKLENSNYGEHLHGYVPFLESIIENSATDIAVYGSIDGRFRTIRKNGGKQTLFFHAKDIERTKDGDLLFENLLLQMDLTIKKERLSLGFNPAEQPKINNYTK